MPKYGCREKPQVNEGTVPHEHAQQPPSRPLRPAIEERSWLSSDHSAEPVLELLGALGWPIVDTPEANVHCTSPDGRIYVGWLPDDPGAWQREIVWRVRVQPANAQPWTQEFGLHTRPRPSPDSSPPWSPPPLADPAHPPEGLP